MAKFLPDVVPPAEYVRGMKAFLKMPLEQAVGVLNQSIRAIDDGDYHMAALFAMGASILAGRHYPTRPNDALKVTAVAEVLMNYAINRQPIPAAAVAGLGATREGRTWISKKIALLRREGYGSAQAAAIAYSMARKRGYDVPRQRRMQGLSRASQIARTAALVRMLESA